MYLLKRICKGIALNKLQVITAQLQVAYSARLQIIVDKMMMTAFMAHFRHRCGLSRSGVAVFLVYIGRQMWESLR